MSSPTELVGQRCGGAIQPFRLHRPDSAEEAVALHAEAEGGAAYMAGGLDLVDRMKGGDTPAAVVHLGRVSALRSIYVDGGSLCIGAGVTHREASGNPELRRRLPGLASAWAGIGHARVQCKGTLGGSLLAGNPDYELAPMLMALDATAFIHAAGPDGATIAESLTTSGLLLSVRLPARSQQLRIDRSLRPVAGLALALDFDGGFVSAARVAISCAYRSAIVRTVPLRRPSSQKELTRDAAGLAAAVVAVLPLPLGDWRATAAYRLRMIHVLLCRLLEQEGEAVP